MNIVLGALNAVLEGNKILLIKRVYPPYKGYWVMPGGKIEAGEHVEEAALRELKEETGITGKFLGIRGIASEILHAENNEKKAHFLFFVCEIKPDHGSLIESPEGKLKWFRLSELKKKNKVFPSDVEMIKEFILGKKHRLRLHKIKIKEKGKTYELESFYC